MSEKKENWDDFDAIVLTPFMDNCNWKTLFKIAK